MKVSVRHTLKKLWIVLVAVAILNPSATRAADKLKVVATFSVIGDMVAAAAGDHVQLTILVGPGGDTELYKPSLADGKTVAEANILFMNGLNDEFEPWLEPLLKQAGFTGTRVVVSRGARTLTASEEHSISGKLLPAAIDQHAWLDPKNGVAYVKNIVEALARRDPVNAIDYRARAAAYIKELQDLDAWAKAEMATVPAAKRRVIASHDSLEYLSKAFGITMISVSGWTNKSEPSAAELGQLTKQIQQEHIHALFIDSITDPRAIERVAKETEAHIGGTLYGDALSKPGGEADTYINMIRHDIIALKAGMLQD
jgi:zinc/manganese transport system substrate-binding protein